MNFDNSTIDSSVVNGTSITVNGTVSSTTSISNSRLLSGSASTISIGSGSLCSVGNISVSSTNTNPITGSGTLNLGFVVFPNTGNIINVTNITLFPVIGGQYYGRNTNTAPSAGMIGEQIRAVLASGSAMSLTTTQGKSLTSINLTPGIWDVTGIVEFIPNATTSINQQVASISIVNNTIGSALGDDTILFNYIATSVQIGFGPAISVPALRISLSATTTYLLVAQATFTASTTDCILVEYQRHESLNIGS